MYHTRLNITTKKLQSPLVTLTSSLNTFHGSLKKCQVNVLPDTFKYISIIYFSRDINDAEIAATHGTVPMIPTEPAIALMSSIATKSVLISWVKDTP